MRYAAILKEFEEDCGEYNIGICPQDYRVVIVPEGQTIAPCTERDDWVRPYLGDRYYLVSFVEIIEVLNADEVTFKATDGTIGVAR